MGRIAVAITKDDLRRALRSFGSIRARDAASLRAHAFVDRLLVLDGQPDVFELDVEDAHAKPLLGRRLDVLDHGRAEGHGGLNAALVFGSVA